MALVGLLVFALARPDLPQFSGKGILGRALTYPIATLIVPVGWWIVVRRHSVRVQRGAVGQRSRRTRNLEASQLSRRSGAGSEYPYALDILIVLPFLIDTAGNAANLYDTIDWWDDANHFVNWGILVAAFGQFLLRLPIGRLELAALAIGFGAVTAVLWEFGEYFTFIRNNQNELRTAYTDTLGDLGLGLSGSVVAALATALLLAPRRQQPPLSAESRLDRPR